MNGVLSTEFCTNKEERAKLQEKVKATWWWPRMSRYIPDRGKKQKVDGDGGAIWTKSKAMLKDGRRNNEIPIHSKWKLPLPPSRKWKSVSAREDFSRKNYFLLRYRSFGPSMSRRSVSGRGKEPWTGKLTLCTRTSWFLDYWLLLGITCWDVSASFSRQILGTISQQRKELN